MAMSPGTDTKSELEQYGVWVKAEPQDVVEDASVSGDFSVEGDLAEAPSSVSEESFLSEDEEKLLGTFDSEFEADSSGPLPDLEDMPALEESALSAESEPSPAEAGGAEDFVSKAIDIELEEVADAGASPSFHPGVEIDMSSVEGLESPDNSEKRSESTIEDVSSEFLDDSGKPEASAPSSSGEASQFVSGMDDVTAEFLDIEESIAAPKASVDSSTDFESLDIDLHFDDSVASAGPGQVKPPSEEEGFEAVTEFDDFLSSDSAPEPSRAEAGFDDVAAVERELSSPSEAPASLSARAVAPSVQPKPDLSTEILLKIADELSSIRGELVSLKSKIGEVIVAGEAAPGKSSEEAAESQEDSLSSGGFFDEEEDETIALTGDELDNILNTADFTTEEPAEAEQPLGLEDESLASDLASSELDLLSESILPESGDYSAPTVEPAIEEVRLGEADSVDAVVEEQSDLDLVAEDGVVPLTNAPDDTSYLESPEDLELEGASLPEDKPLVEPDLSDFDLGVEELEPGIEVEEELPLAGGEIPSEAADITLGMEAAPNYAELASSSELPSEAEFIEAIPEIEETSFSEINLHEENISEPSEVEEIEPLSDEDEAIIPEISEEEDDLMLSAVEEPSPPPTPHPISSSAAAPSSGDDGDRLKSEIKSVLSYLDKLLDSLPEEKIDRKSVV